MGVNRFVRYFVGVKRHWHANYTVMNGNSKTVVSQMLGRSNVGMTLRCMQLADRDFGAAAERVDQANDELIDLMTERKSVKKQVLVSAYAALVAQHFIWRRCLIHLNSNEST